MLGATDPSPLRNAMGNTIAGPLLWWATVSRSGGVAVQNQAKKSMEVSLPMNMRVFLGSLPEDLLSHAEELIRAVPAGQDEIYALRVRIRYIDGILNLERVL